MDIHTHAPSTHAFSEAHTHTPERHVQMCPLQSSRPRCPPLDVGILKTGRGYFSRGGRCGCGWMCGTRTCFSARGLRKTFDSLKEIDVCPQIPLHTDGTETVYMCGNSLGLAPKSTAGVVNGELEKWGRVGVKGHFEGDIPWATCEELLPDLAKVRSAPWSPTSATSPAFIPSPNGSPALASPHLSRSRL
jgi:hypothetical protein